VVWPPPLCSCRGVSRRSAGLWMTPGGPLVSPRFVRRCVPADWYQRIAAGTAWPQRVLCPTSESTGFLAFSNR
jgi:hypothetical protein